MSKLYASISGASNILSASVTESHASSTSIASFDCLSHTLDIGNHIDIYLGYETNYDKVFSGYVKQIDRKIPNNVYTITAYDDLIRALDFFIASSTPDNPFTRENIAAEDLVYDVLSLAGLNSFDLGTSYFTLAIGFPAEVNLVSSYDYAKSIADYVAWNIWADRNGVVHFKNRKPYPMDGTSGQPGDVNDSPIATITTSTDVLSFGHVTSEKNLRNKIVVYGIEGINADASSATSYDPLLDQFRQILPSGFYKTVVFATQLITQNNYAQDSADYNLALLNRLTQEVNLAVIGNPDLSARNTITLTDDMYSLSGEWYIYQLEHTWSKNGFITTMSLRL